MQVGGKSEHLCLDSDLRGKTFNPSLLNMLAVGFSFMSFLCCGDFLLFIAY